MRCDEVQELASPWLDESLSDTRARAVEVHVTGCAACQTYIADLRILSAELRRLGRQQPPARLEHRVREALATEQGRPIVASRSSHPWRGIVQQAASMAAVCVLSVGVTWAVMQPAPVANSGHDVVAAHIRSLLQDTPIQVVSSDSHTVRPWFNGKVEFAPPVKDLTPEGFPLVGGRLDFVDGHRVATLVYKRRLHTISVFVWPEDRVSEGPSPRSDGHAAGLNLLTWRKDGMIWWAVSDLNPDELRELRTLL